MSAAGHSGQHCTKRNNMDQHDRAIIPKNTNGEPAKDANKKKIKVPGRPAECGRRVAHDLDNRRDPFDDEGNAVLCR